MKRLALLAAFFLGGLQAFAQIDIRCALDAAQALQYEPIRLTLQIVNNAGEDLVLRGPEANAALSFEIEQLDGELLPCKREQIFPEGLRIPSRQPVVRMINLLDYYDMRKEGPYSIRARLDWRGKAYLSPKVLLDVFPCVEIGRFSAGRPSGGEVRVCTLRVATRDHADHLFVRIDDEEQGMCFGVYDVGRIVRLFTPVIQMDAAGQFHVLHQSGPWRYTHSIFTSEGVPVSSRFYTAELNDVSLAETEDGTVSVKGGGAYDGGPAIPPPDRNPEKPQGPVSMPVDE